MKKFILAFLLLSSIAFAAVSVSLGFSPYQGTLGVEYTFQNIPFSINIHSSGYDSDYNFLGGLGLAYRFNGETGPYAFHSSEWINGDKSGSMILFDNNGNVIRRTDWKKEINYWRLVFGFGYQHMFFKHFGAFFEMGYEFYAGNGGYYTHFDIDDGSLDNDQQVFPVGLGIKYSF